MHNVVWGCAEILPLHGSESRGNKTTETNYLFSFWFDQAAVQQLYEFRDHYFEHNSIEKAPLKKKETEQKLKETLNILDHVQGKDKSF